jgi:23S rRNA (cytidine1920-2'-O)/16S rRNA (cytidine1409-2'-O)-methyltransferase
LAAGKKKQRLDALIVERRLAENINGARRLILAGCVQIANRVCDKAGYLVDPSSSVVVKTAKRFVSRGGDKLEAGLLGTGMNLQGFICADIGCSTGGFTDCLLQHGVGKVYCVDVGYGLLDWRLRQDERVVVLERTNARHLTRQQIAEPLDLVVIDASFISLEPLLAPLLPLFRNVIRILALVKPQFQLPREMVGTGGIVDDSSLHQLALAMVRQFGQDLGLRCAGIVASPIRGAKGNQEFFMLLTDSSGEKNDGTKYLEQGECDVVSTTD